MDVFISWSGEQSRQVAVELAEWLPAVLQRVRPFVSDKDIHSGARWQAEVTGQLEACSFGIVVVTSDNQFNSWLQFEAGALSKAVNDSRVVPLLVDLKKSDLLLPLNMFQAESLDEPGIASLLGSLNKATSEPMPEATVRALAAKWWPDLAREISKVKVVKRNADSPTERTDRELLEELVTMVRSLRNAPAALQSWTEADVTSLLRDAAPGSVKIKLDTKADRKRTEDYIAHVSNTLRATGIEDPGLQRTGLDSFEIDLRGQHLPEDVADILGRRAVKLGLGISFINIDGRGDLQYDGHMI